MECEASQPTSHEQATLITFAPLAFIIFREFAIIYFGQPKYYESNSCLISHSFHLMEANENLGIHSATTCI